MSIHVIAWVIEHAVVGTPSELLVLLMLANHAGRDGGDAYPNTRTLARECRMSRRQVQRLLGDLVAAGHLEVTGLLAHGVKRYRIVGIRDDKLSPLLAREGRLAVTGEVTRCHPGGDNREHEPRSNRPLAVLLAGTDDLWKGWDPKWVPVRGALESRGLRYPPTIRQRETLWPILDARPDDLVTWIRAAPAEAKAADVFAYVLDRWRNRREQLARTRQDLRTTS